MHDYVFSLLFGVSMVTFLRQLDIFRLDTVRLTFGIFDRDDSFGSPLSMDFTMQACSLHAYFFVYEQLFLHQGSA